MTYMKNENTNADPEEFWDLGIVSAPKGRLRKASEAHTSPADMEIDPPEPAISAPASVRKRTYPAEKKTPESSVRRSVTHEKMQVSEYVPDDSLIHNVKVFTWHTNYSYYEQFCRVAARVDGIEGKPVPYVPFFSYMPQYSQLTESQFAYYLWMREEIRRGRAPEADYSYILLYIYELINLSDRKPVREILDSLTDIWIFYRGQYPRLDVQLSDWICDFCLINRLRPDFDRLNTFGTELVRSATLKEFYVDTRSGGDVRAKLLMTYCSNYDYTKSKFATGENRNLYVKHMTGVVSSVLEGAKTGKSPVFASGLQDSRISRDAYTGALCSPKIKKRIEIEYTSFTHSHELRFIITDLLKYSENRIRAYLGIKSRLSCSGITPEMKTAADTYFDEHLPLKSRSHNEHEIPAYERLYEPTSTGLSYENAAEIEKLSWDTTDKLLDAFSETDRDDLPADDNVLNDTVTISPDAQIFGADEDPSETEKENDTVFTHEELSFLVAALSLDVIGQKKAAESSGQLPDAMADTINEKSLDILGDMVLEDVGGSYYVIDDYADEVKQWIGL